MADGIANCSNESNVVVARRFPPGKISSSVWESTFEQTSKGGGLCGQLPFISFLVSLSNDDVVVINQFEEVDRELILPEKHYIPHVINSFEGKRLSLSVSGKLPNCLAAAISRLGQLALSPNNAKAGAIQEFNSSLAVDPAARAGALRVYRNALTPAVRLLKLLSPPTRRSRVLPSPAIPARRRALRSNHASFSPIHFHEHRSHHRFTRATDSRDRADGRA